MLTTPNRSSSGVNQVVLSTAHPAKFAEAVTGSLESAGATFDFERDVLPVEMHGLLERERRVRDVELPATQGGKVERLADATRAVIEEVADRTPAARPNEATQSI